jgi:hypothetical protein
MVVHADSSGVRQVAGCDRCSVIPITLAYGLGDVFGGNSVSVKVNDKLQVRSVNLDGN